jgi:hypothetical protein
MPLLDALGLLHAAQGHHGQISAANILVRNDGSPVLLGFGFPDRVAGDKTGPTGPWTDLHALARVLHFAISGEAAMSAPERGSDERASSLVDAAPALRRLFPDLHCSTPFLAGIDRVLALRPRHRLASVAEFLQWLDRASDAPQPASPAPVPAARVPTLGEERSVVSAARHAAAPMRPRWRPWMAGLCLAVLSAGGGWWWVQAQTELPPVAAPAAKVSEAPAVPAVAPAPAPAVVDAPASAAETPQPVATPAPAASDPGVAVASSEPEPAPLTTVAKAPAKRAAPEPDNPRAMCGARTNFSLYFCMEKQCKRPLFAQHPQCAALKRGEVN